jgi:hypothetical protein
MSLPARFKPLISALRWLWSKDLFPLGVSIVLQLTLALFFGHLIDMRVNMAAGYLTASGQNPYPVHDLSGVFHNGIFSDFATIGYPPPWPLLLALIYKCVHVPIPGLLAYNLAIKLPIIAANIAVAWSVRSAIVKLGGTGPVARRAWFFMLFNPFILYATAAWGQIDSIVAVLLFMVVALLASGKFVQSALIAGLAVAFKPVALPILPLAIAYAAHRSGRMAGVYGMIAIAAAALLCAAPFFLFGWDPAVITKNWNVHCIAAGCMSIFSFMELFRDSTRLTGAWQIAGYLWLPALGVTTYFLSYGNDGRGDLLNKTAVMFLVFFLTRSWLSEPNVVVLVPFLVIAASTGTISRPALHAVWIVALLFSVFNASFALLFFPSMPHVMDRLLVVAADYRLERLIARSAMVAIWFVIGWRLVAVFLKKTSVSAELVR